MVLGNYSNLSVTMIPPATKYGPVDGRKYTLMKDKEKESEYYLAIGYRFDANIVNNDAKKILTAQWLRQMGQYKLKGTIKFKTNETDLQIAQKHRDFHKMVAQLIHGDHDFYRHVPWLMDAPIYIQLESSDLQSGTIQYCGTPRHHLNTPIVKHR